VVAVREDGRSEGHTAAALGILLVEQVAEFVALGVVLFGERVGAEEVFGRLRVT
jgi:hypothetical protein